MGDDEARFVARLVARDESAFNELVLLFERRVFALSVRMLGRRADAEEVTQDVFVQVFRSVDSFRGEAKLSTWVFRIAVNLCKNKMNYDARRHSRRHDDLVDYQDLDALSGGAGLSVGAIARPDHAFEERQVVEAVREAIELLDLDLRQVVILRDVEELAYEEIAEVMGLQIGTVKSRIHRGRAQLREKLERVMAKRVVGKVNE